MESFNNIESFIQENNEYDCTIQIQHLHFEEDPLHFDDIYFRGNDLSHCDRLFFKEDETINLLENKQPTEEHLPQQETPSQSLLENKVREIKIPPIINTISKKLYINVFYS
jgi:hypothetical protein